MRIQNPPPPVMIRRVGLLRRYERNVVWSIDVDSVSVAERLPILGDSPDICVATYNMVTRCGRHWAMYKKILQYLGIILVELARGEIDVRETISAGWHGSYHVTEREPAGHAGTVECLRWGGVYAGVVLGKRSES